MGGASAKAAHSRVPPRSVNMNVLRPSLQSRTPAGTYPDRYFRAPKLRGRPLNPELDDYTTRACIDAASSKLDDRLEQDGARSAGGSTKTSDGYMYSAFSSESEDDESDTDIITGESYALTARRLQHSRIETFYLSSCERRGTSHSQRVLSVLVSSTAGAHVHTIDLTNAGLGQSGIAALADTLLYAAGELGRGSILRTLRLSGNNCRDAGADGIASLVPMCKTLQHMSMDNNGLGPRAGEKMARAISRSRSLLSFSACGNPRFGRGLLEGLAEADVILSGVSQFLLRDVGLNGVSHGPSKKSNNSGNTLAVAGTEIVALDDDDEINSESQNYLSLEECISAFGRRLRSQMRDLQLGWNCLRDAPVIALLDVLGKEATTEDLLCMQEGKIAALTAQKVDEEKRLKEEAKKEERREKRKKYEWDHDSSDDDDGSGGGGDGKGADKIPQALDDTLSHSFLVRLGLDTCGLRDKSGVAISQFIYCSNTLEEVDISSNHFGPDTAFALAVGVRSSPSLRVLHASFNPFGIEGTCAIVGACSASPPPTPHQVAVAAAKAAATESKRKGSPSKNANKKKNNKKDEGKDKSKNKKRTRFGSAEKAKASLPDGVGLPPNTSLRQLYLMNTCWSTDLEAGNFHGIVEGGGFGLVAESASEKKERGKKKGNNGGKKKPKNNNNSQKSTTAVAAAKVKASAKATAKANAAKANAAARFAVGPGPSGGASQMAADSSKGNARVVELPPGWKPAIPASKLGPEHTERLRALRTFSRDTVQTRDQYLYLRLAYPYEAGLLLFENSDQVALENDEDSGAEENAKDGNGSEGKARDDEYEERDPSYRSAFTWRCVENEANTYYDTKRTLKRAFESDWAYSRIESLLVGDAAELANVRSVMQKNFRFVHELYRYESAQEPVGNDLRVTLKGWVGLIKLLKLMGGGGSGGGGGGGGGGGSGGGGSGSGGTGGGGSSSLRLNDLHDVFYQALATGGDADNLPADLEHETFGPGLWRFQFMEAIVRLGKLTARKGVNLSASLRELFEFTLKPRTFQVSHVGSTPGPEFFKDARNFRESLLYYEEVSGVLLEEEENLRRLYKAYARGDGDFSFHADFKLTMREWCNFCESCNLNFRRYGVSVKDHRLAFVYSRTCIVDPLGKSGGGSGGGGRGSGGGRGGGGGGQKRVEMNATLAQMTYTDFLEALARLACMLRHESYPEGAATLSTRLRLLVKDVLHVNRILISQSGEDDHIVAKDLAREAKLRLQEEQVISGHHPAPDYGRVEERSYRMSVGAAAGRATGRK
jgi:hypothetical protein